MGENIVECAIIMYHYIRNNENTSSSDIPSRKIPEFIYQLKYLQKKYEIISFSTYHEYLLEQIEFKQNVCILSFDDGLVDHYTVVFPILKKFEISGIFFPMTQPLYQKQIADVQKIQYLLAKLGSILFSKFFNNYLKTEAPELYPTYVVNTSKYQDRRYIWDDALTTNLKYSIRLLPSTIRSDFLQILFNTNMGDESEWIDKIYLDEQQIKEMSEFGMEFGGHSHSHPFLNSLDYQDQKTDIDFSTQYLKNILNKPINVFSYPNGLYNNDTIEILKNNSYIYGVTTNFGVNQERSIEKFKLLRLDTNHIPISSG